MEGVRMHVSCIIFQTSKICSKSVGGVESILHTVLQMITVRSIDIPASEKIFQFSWRSRAYTGDNPRQIILLASIIKQGEYI